jgi:uncharacterized tellurite resistance protein B-like protein
MIFTFKSLLRKFLAETPESKEQDKVIAMVALLFEVSFADQSSSEKEEKVIINALSHLLKIDQPEAETLLAEGKKAKLAGNSLFEFTDQLSELSQEERIHFIKIMWNVAYADDYLDPIEEAVIRKVAKLLYVDHNQFIKMKLTVLENR